MKRRRAYCKDHGGRALDHTYCPDCEAELDEDMAAAESKETEPQAQ